jgi:hypothetical protein
VTAQAPNLYQGKATEGAENAGDNHCGLVGLVAPGSSHCLHLKRVHLRPASPSLRNDSNQVRPGPKDWLLKRGSRK